MIEWLTVTLVQYFEYDLINTLAPLFMRQLCQTEHYSFIGVREQIRLRQLVKTTEPLGMQGMNKLW